MHLPSYNKNETALKSRENRVSHGHSQDGGGRRSSVIAASKLRQKLNTMSPANKVKGAVTSVSKRKSSILLDPNRDNKVYPSEDPYQCNFNKRDAKLDRLRELVHRSRSESKSNRSEALIASSETYSSTTNTIELDDFIIYEKQIKKHPLLQFESPPKKLTKDYLSMAKEYRRLKPYRSKLVCSRCVLCNAREATMVIFPCEHCCICGSCRRTGTKTIQKCPLCNEHIKRLIRRSGSELNIYWQWVEEVSFHFK